ncbi:hypothetical protein HDU97_005487 [Phlyctochytrium planicorne]|nr:hypothetical protein HDU97_005487 [Phlyctochytrium planicorne]
MQLEDSAVPNDDKLSLHIGAILGTFQHVILGNSNSRLEYCIHGPSLSELSVLLDSTAAGEMALNEALENAITRFGAFDRYSLLRLPILKNNFIILSLDNHRDAYTAIAYQYLQHHRGDLPPISPPPASDKPQPVLSTSRRQSRASERGPSMGYGNAMSFGDGLPDPLFRFVNTSFLSRVAAGTHMNLKPDYRRVSVLFAKLSGKFDPERVQMVVVEFVEAVKLFNGVFQHFSVDDKGQNILAFFGLPPFTHENSALFAAKAAFKFAGFFRDDDPFAPAVSVGTGDCLNELLETTQRREIFIMGDFINVAARLLTINSDATNIILDNDTRALICKDFNCQSLGMQKVKGKEEPIPVWGLLKTEKIDRKSRYQEDLAAYIGYGKESAQLLEGYFSWKHNQTGFWSLVQGDSGSGKSCLMSRVSKQMLETGCNVFMARGSEVEQWTPYFGVQPILCHILTLSSNFQYETSQSVSGIGGSSVASSCNLGMGKNYGIQEFENILIECGEDPIYAPALAHVLPWIKNELGQKLSASSKNGIISSVLLKVMNYYLSKGDCVLVVDDAQVFASTEDFSLLIVVSTSREEVVNGLDRFTSLSFVAQFRLTGLGREDSALLMSSLLKTERVPSDIFEAIYGRTNGNIIQTQMICESLQSQKGDIFHDPTTYQGVKDATKFERIVYGSSASIISSQLDRLSQEFNKLLKSSSVLGQYFCLEEVKYLLLPEVFDVESLIKMIEEDDVFQYLSFSVNGLDAGGNAFVGKTFCSFRHIRIMYAIYDSISMSERTVLHERIAEFYETAAKSDPKMRKQMLPSLHHHYSKTSNVEKMISFAEEYGDVQYSSGLYNEAGVYYAKCLEYSKAFPKSSTTPYQQCAILSKLSYCLALPMTSIDRATVLAVEALKIAGEEWAEDQETMAKIMKKDMKRLVRHWFLSRQGLRDIHFTNEKEKRQHEWYKIIRHALFSLMNAALCDASMRAELKRMILLKTLLYTLTEAKSSPGELFNTLHFFIYGLIAFPTKATVAMARYFSNRSGKILANCGREIMTNFTTYGGIQMFLRNDPAKMIQIFGTLLEYSTEIRRHAFISRGYIWVWVAWFSKGVLNVPTVMKNPFLPHCIREDPAWVVVSMYGPLTCSFLMDNRDLFEEYLTFHAYTLNLTPEKAFRAIRLHRHVFELMGMLLRKQPEDLIAEKFVEVYKDCDRFLGREPDAAFGYSVIICLLAGSRLMSQRFRNVLVECVKEKLDIYKTLSIQGYFSNFNYFMIQAAAYRLGVSKPPTKFARFLRSERGKWAPGGDFGFLRIFGQGILAVHCPKLMSRRLNVGDIAYRFRQAQALLLDTWVRGDAKFTA